MSINTTYVERCVRTLDKAYLMLQNADASIDRDIYRSACVKEFEIILEQVYKLLKKRLGDYFSNTRKLDQLSFKDTFRHATKFGIIDTNLCERWLTYRDKRNISAHEYGEGIADETINFLSEFIVDVESTLSAITTEL